MGTKRMKSLDTCTLDDLEYCMNGNFKALYLITKKTSPHLIKSQGRIITLNKSCLIGKIYTHLAMIRNILLVIKLGALTI